MHRSQLLLCLALAAVAACSEPATSPIANGQQAVPDVPRLETLYGVVETTADERRRFALRRFDRAGLVFLIGEQAEALEDMIGTQVAVTGSFTSAGEFRVENVAPIGGRPY